MKTTTRVAVIGGGVVGCSVLYHLTKLGWSDVMLIERSELTSGSTWHAAGGFHTLNGDTNMAALQGYTIRLYRELEAITGMSCGLHHVGGITLADNRDRFDMLVAERAKHRYMGLETEIVGPEEIARMAPIVNLDGIVGGLYDPLDGHLDPSGTTHAYAKAARMGGAEIVLHNRVLETNPTAEGWEVVTEKGTVYCEHLVNAGGLWAREIGAMAGVYLPLLPMAPVEPRLSVPAVSVVPPVYVLAPDKVKVPVPTLVNPPVCEITPLNVVLVLLPPEVKVAAPNWI